VVKQAGVILCGGKSVRMGSAKATLPFGDETMLQRVVRLLGEVASPIVVVAARSQILPPLRQDVVVAHDARDERGPLEGLATGLRALPGNVDAADATSCDGPLLVPEFVEQMFASIGKHEIAVPKDEKHHPLSAVYRPQVIDRIDQMLAEDCLQLRGLLARCDTLEVPSVTLRAADPELRSLMNCNRPDEYHAALRMAGLDSNAR